MQSTIKHIKHLFTATNQHGVHSPFVYNYMTKCLYVKQGYSKKKPTDILLKSIAYFNTEVLFLPSGAKDLKKIALQKFPAMQFNPSPYDMIYLDGSDLKSIKTLLSADDQIHNDTVLVMSGIHNSRTAELEWDWIKTHEKVRVTIDLFYCGVVFFRTEQAKEHFKIRI